MNLDKSSLVPSQTVVYLGIKIESQTFRASQTLLRIERFFSIAEEFLSSKVQSAKFWSAPWPPRVADAPRSRRSASDEGSLVSSQTRLQ